MDELEVIFEMEYHCIFCEFHNPDANFALVHELATGHITLLL